MLRGSEAYKAWLDRMFPRVRCCEMTIMTGGDDWWWEGLDRASGLILLETGEIEPVECLDWWVPAPAPAGLDYSDLIRGHLRTGGRDIRERRSDRASGGRTIG